MAPELYREAILRDATNTTYAETDLARVIRHLPPALPSTTTCCRLPEDASLGALDRLPAEILLMVLGLADLQSLSRLSRVSTRCRFMVENLPRYRKVLARVSKAVVALAQTKLLGVHSPDVVHEAFFSRECASCFDFGGFLFLPTCERVCLTCLDENIALRVIPVELACDVFGLTEEQISKVPVLYSIPGTYGIYDTSRDKTHSEVERLVCVKQVKKLALSVHGLDLAHLPYSHLLHDAPLDPPPAAISPSSHPQRTMTTPAWPRPLWRRGPRMPVQRLHDGV